MTVHEIAPLAAMALGGMLVPVIWRWLRRFVAHLIYRARTRPFRRIPPERLDTQEAEEFRTVHVYYDPGDGTKQLLYRGPDAIQAKHHFYRKGHPGHYSFWIGSACRGTRDSDR